MVTRKIPVKEDMYDPARAEKLLKYHLSKKLYSPHIQNDMDVYLNNNYGTPSCRKPSHCPDVSLIFQSLCGIKPRSLYGKIAECYPCNKYQDYT